MRFMYGTSLQQVNVLARVLACNTHADLSRTRAASQTIHEVHVSPHAILKSISRVFKFNNIIMYMVIDYRHAFRIIGNDHI